MRIGFDAKRIFHNLSGLGNYGRDVLRMLSAQYPQNDYFLYNPKPGKADRFHPAENMQICFPNGTVNKKISSLWRRRMIVKQLKNDRLDLYHGLSNELPVGIRESNVKAIVTIHDLIFIRYPQWYSKPDQIIHKLKVKQAAKDARRIIAISEQTKKDVIDFLQIPPEKINVIYQGCHAAFKQTYSPDQQSKVRNKFNLPGSFLLNVGTIEERKNLLTIVKSLKYHSLPLIVIGRETKYAQKVRQFISQEKLEDRVHFLRSVGMEELAIIYQLATIFCYPSVFEGFGIPIIEALYSRVPVITSRGGCFSEAGGPSSAYIDCFDDKAMAEKINEFTNDPSLYQATVKNGLQYAQQFNDEKIAKNMMQIYQEVIHARSE